MKVSCSREIVSLISLFYIESLCPWEGIFPVWLPTCDRNALRGDGLSVSMLIDPFLRSFLIRTYTSHDIHVLFIFIFTCFQSSARSVDMGSTYLSNPTEGFKNSIQSFRARRLAQKE